jgi:hypothetical protein
MAMKLGMNAQVYYHATATTALSGMTLIATGVRDVSLSISAATAKVTTRNSGGWEQELPTLKSLEVSMKIPLDPTDAFYQQLSTSFLANGTFAAAFLTDTKATSGATGPVGDFCVTKFDRAEPLDGAMEMDVTLKLAKFTAWNSTS